MYFYKALLRARCSCILASRKKRAYNKLYFKGQDVIQHYDISTCTIKQVDRGDGVIRVFINPDATEKDFLINELQLDEHNIASALDPDELSRIEFETNHLAVIFKRPQNYTFQKELLFKVSSFGLFIFQESLIIITPEAFNLFEGKQFHKIDSLFDVVFKIMYGTISHFYRHLKVISAISDEIEQKINTSMENKHLINMFTLQKSLVYYLDAVNSNLGVVERLKNNAQKLKLTPENVEIVDDITIESKQCEKQAEVYLNILSSLMDARASIISNNLNVMMKNLNALVISVAVPSFIAGVGGMSEFSGMIGFSNWKFGYPIFLGVMILIGGTTFFIIKKAGRFWQNT